jgi:hypothetical protein
MLSGCVGIGAWLLLRKAKTEIPLSAGWNEITYTGDRKPAEVIMEPISDYLEIIYYFNEGKQSWQQIVYDTILESGMILHIKVSHDCILTV